MRRLGPLYLQVLIAILLGILVGYLFPRTGVALKPLGDGFIRLIRMLLAPIVFSTIVVGIARMGDLKEVGRVGLKALLYFEVVSTISLAMGLLVIDIIRPGAGMNVDPHALDAHAIAGYAGAAAKTSVVDWLLNIIPTSIGDAFVRGDMLQIILFSILLGLALAQVRARAQPLVDVLDTFLHAMFDVVRMVMRVAPLGAFGAMAFTIGQYGVASLVSLGELTALIYLTCAAFVLIVLGAIARFTGFSILKFLRYIRAEILITFGTSSSESVLAPVMEKLERLGCATPVVGMVMPAGYTFNADGSSIYLTMGALFVAQATNTPLTLGDQLVVLAVMMLTSKGSAGVAGATFVVMAATLASMNKIPVAGLVLLLGVDRFSNAARAITNVIGNGVATIVVARWENAIDMRRARQILDGQPEQAEEQLALSSD
ncbi:MAG: C4-dicarboxylate transporter DctA [Acidisphaera sp.]|nr:C4-dicarboxylate transporter DctA [Acidisphaera sp.]